MISRLATFVAVLLAVVGQAWADATQRQVVEIKYNPLLAQLGPEFKQIIVSRVPQETVTRVKGDRAFTTIEGASAIIDYRKKQITLLHPGLRRYTTLSFADYVTLARAEQIANPVSAGDIKNVTSFKPSLQTKRTGRFMKFNGVESEETLCTISIDTSKDQTNPGGVRMEMQIWIPKREELARLPALKELATASTRNEEVFNSWETLQHLMAQMPGLGAPFQDVLSDIAKNSSAPPISMHIRVYSPLLEQLAKAIQMAGQKLSPDIDPAGSLAEVTIDWSDISAAPLAESLFQVPVGYRQSSIAEFAQAMNQAATATVPSDLPLITESTTGSANPAIPAVVSSSPAEYTTEARKAGIEGTVLLQATVDADGVARNLKVVWSLDAGLDQKAIEAVGKWIFRPAQKAGASTPADVQIEVRFRMSDRH